MLSASSLVGCRAPVVADEVHQNRGLARLREGHRVCLSVSQTGVHSRSGRLHALEAVRGQASVFCVIRVENTRDDVLLDSVRVYRLDVPVPEFILDQSVGKRVQGYGVSELRSHLVQKSARLDEGSQPIDRGQRIRPAVAKGRKVHGCAIRTRPGAYVSPARILPGRISFPARCRTVIQRFPASCNAGTLREHGRSWLVPCDVQGLSCNWCCA
jgi:hypothetical protein